MVQGCCSLRIFRRHHALNGKRSTARILAISEMENGFRRCCAQRLQHVPKGLEQRSQVHVLETSSCLQCVPNPLASFSSIYELLTHLQQDLVKRLQLLHKILVFLRRSARIGPSLSDRDNILSHTVERYLRTLSMYAVPLISHQSSMICSWSIARNIIADEVELDTRQPPIERAL